MNQSKRSFLRGVFSVVVGSTAGAGALELLAIESGATHALSEIGPKEMKEKLTAEQTEYIASTRENGIRIGIGLGAATALGITNTLHAVLRR